MNEEKSVMVVSIGNSDDKLSQSQWNSFVRDVRIALYERALQTHFFGGSSTWMPWQNVAWIVELSKDEDYDAICKNLKDIREKYNQTSVMVVYQKPTFV